MHRIPILRTEQTAEQTPPWHGIMFELKVGSDELAEALKAAFPQCETLSERKHVAAIQFLEHELSYIRSGAPIPVLAKVTPILDLPFVGTRFDRPQTENQVVTPDATSTSHSPASSIHSIRQKPRYEQTASQMSSPSTTYTESTAAIPGHHFVFNASDGMAMQQKTKRKMTAEEKAAYKETRKRGACDKCKRQKGKCTHIYNMGPEYHSPEPNVPDIYHKTNTGSHDPKRSKMIKTWRTADDHDHMGHSTSQYSEPLHEDSAPQHSLNGASGQSESAAIATQWAVASMENTENYMSGYVNQSNSVDEHHNLPYIDQEPSWCNLDSSEPSSFLSEVSDLLWNPSQDSATFPGCPDIRVYEPGMEFPSSSEFVPEPWTQSQQPWPGNYDIT